MSSEVTEPPEIEVVIEVTIEVVKRQRPPANQWTQAQHSSTLKGLSNVENSQKALWVVPSAYSPIGESACVLATLTY